MEIDGTTTFLLVIFIGSMGRNSNSISNRSHKTSKNNPLYALKRHTANMWFEKWFEGMALIHPNSGREKGKLVPWSLWWFCNLSNGSFEKWTNVKYTCHFSHFAISQIWWKLNHLPLFLPSGWRIEATSYDGLKDALPLIVHINFQFLVRHI